ncbi:MAG TPA: ABC transporter ATP-binding protein [Candidatus Pelethocola excrementipullorum]|nr:ABC transporter ATP-binding protein [Candidatus Pelethocola excrementipullorum]
MNELLSCQKVSKRYNNNWALSEVNLNLKRGRIIGLLGPNGSGKTTLLKMINGLVVPTSGEILINGCPPGVESKRIVSYLPDHMYLGSWNYVRDLVSYFSDFYEDFDSSRALDMLTKLGIGLKDKLPHMSKGTKEKVQLIMVMSRRAQLYCLDEPIGGVDPAARDYILSTILNNYDENATIFISTHLISDIENILDEVLFLKDGKLVMQSTVDEIRQNKGESVDSLFREVFKC